MARPTNPCPSSTPISIRPEVLTQRPTPYVPESQRLLPCFPAQNGQKAQSSPSGKSSPSSWGQPMFPSLAATDLTPCLSKNSWISILTFGLVVTSVATHRLMIGSAFGDLMTPAAILVVLLSSGP